MEFAHRCWKTTKVLAAAAAVAVSEALEAIAGRI
jgi:hypothetical protein